MENKIRPRFSYHSNLTHEEINDKLKLGLINKSDITASFIQNKVFLTHIKSLHHYWSPELQISIYDEDGKRVINGLIGPQQTVWAMFLFMYGITFLLGFFIGIYGLILWSLGEASYWLISIPSSIVLLVLIYLAAKYGQKKGRDQMIELVHFFKTNVGLENLNDPKKDSN